MNRDLALAQIRQLRQQATQIELLVEEDDEQSIVEARKELRNLGMTVNQILAQLQASSLLGMTVDDVRDELYQYSGQVTVQVCVPGDDPDGVGSFYLIKSITELTGSSPTIPIIDLGECISA